jgi:hypothetical protein
MAISSNAQMKDLMRVCRRTQNGIQLAATNSDFFKAKIRYGATGYFGLALNFNCRSQHEADALDDATRAPRIVVW